MKTDFYVMVPASTSYPPATYLYNPVQDLNLVPLQFISAQLLDQTVPAKSQYRVKPEINLSRKTMAANGNPAYSKDQTLTTRLH